MTTAVYAESITKMTAAANAILSAISMYLYVGTYTPPTGIGEGVYVYYFNSTTWNLDLVQTAITPSSAFLTLDSKNGFLYTVNNIPDGSVSSFRIDPKTFLLTKVNSKSSSGKGPTHITTDPSGRYVLVGHYGSGNAVVFPVAPDGTLGEISDNWQDDNSDPTHPPRAHMLSFDPSGTNVALVDLGLDKTFSFRFDAEAGKLLPVYQEDGVTQKNAPAPGPGAGPRHIVFSSDSRFAFVINELSSSVTTYSYNSSAASFEILSTVSTLPLDVPANLSNAAAEVALSPDGRFLYASNRGHDSVAVFSVNGTTGHLTPVAHEYSRGRIARFFAFDPTGRYMWVANQDTGNLVVFAVNPSTGTLSFTGHEYSVPSPVCFAFAPIRENHDKYNKY